MRIVFAGTPDTALPSLQRLIDSPRHDVVAVLTRPDAASGRRGSPQPSPVARLALDHGVQIFAHEHYGRIVQPWSCTAVPVHDPFSGEVVGVLDVTGGDVVATPQSMALVQAAVHAVEAELRLQAMTAGPTRLVRPSRRASVDVRRLEVLGVDHGVLRVGGERRVMSQRHSEILLLLCAHPDGLSAEQLALGIIQLAIVKMTSAIKEITVARGHDPRDFVLLRRFGVLSPLTRTRVVLSMARVTCCRAWWWTGLPMSR